LHYSRLTAFAVRVYKGFMTAMQGLITTRFRALIALVLTGWIAALHLHPVTWGRPLPWTWLYAGILPTWAVVVINAFFYGYLIWLGFVFALAQIRKEEKAIWVAICANAILTPARVLVPNLKGFVQMVRTGLSLIAFLAALALLVSLWNEQASKAKS